MEHTDFNAIEIMCLRQAIRFAKEKVTLNINLSYTDTRGAMVN